MKYTTRIGIGPITTSSTTHTAPHICTTSIKDWYDIEISNEYEEDGQILTEDVFHAVCKFEHDGYKCFANGQGDTEQEAIDDCINAIRAIISS